MQGDSPILMGQRSDHIRWSLFRAKCLFQTVEGMRQWTAKTQRNPKSVRLPFRGFGTATHNKNKNITKFIQHCRQMLNWKENNYKFLFMIFFFNVRISTRKKISRQQASIFSCEFLVTANRCLRRRKSRVAAVGADDGRVPVRRVEVPFLLPHDKDITSWSFLVASAVSFFVQNKQTKTCSLSLCIIS